MENITKEIIDILQYLLPGFIAAWVFYGLTSFAKPSQFERVIQALIFTVFIQSFVFIEKQIAFWLYKYISFGDWSKRSELFCSTINALFFGIAFAYFANNDKLHKLARKVGLTRETSYPSEWFGAFLERVTYVVLHLKDERRLYGWIKEWPSEPDKGHFVLVQASWLDEEKIIELTGVESIMVDAKEVQMVEFMKKTWEEKHE